MTFARTALEAVTGADVMVVITEWHEYRGLDPRRIKDVMRLADGTQFSPQYIENRLKFSPYVKEAVVLGEGEKFVSALIQIDLENVGQWATDTLASAITASSTLSTWTQCVIATSGRRNEAISKDWLITRPPATIKSSTAENAETAEKDFFAGRESVQPAKSSAPSWGKIMMSFFSGGLLCQSKRLNSP